MNPHAPESFETLCGLLLDGRISDAQRAELLRRVREEPEALEDLRSQLAISEILEHERPDRLPEHVERVAFDHVTRLGHESDGAFPDRVITSIRRRRTRRRVAATTLAAAAAVAFAVLPFLDRDQPEPASADLPPVVAMGYHLGNGDAIPPRSTIRARETIQLDDGMMRLEFDNGAVVAIEAPARFRVDSPDAMQLESGSLNAWCPESAHGFVVNTSSASLTDLGTSFGVTVDPGGAGNSDDAADFIVLNGEVELSRAGETRNLTEGGSLRATRSTGFQPLDFDSSPFHRTWPVASGIQSTSGEVIPAPPNTPDVVARHEDDEHIIVIPEKRDFTPKRWVPADIHEPGEYLRKSIYGSSGFRPKEPLRSYLLRYNPVGVRTLDDFESFEGSVTFDKRVVAIITASRKLETTDPMFSNAPLPETSEDPNLRGLEPGQPPNPPDRISLSEDRRTVSVLFYAGEAIDEVRVLTEAN